MIFMGTTGPWIPILSFSEKALGNTINTLLLCVGWDIALNRMHHKTGRIEDPELKPGKTVRNKSIKWSLFQYFTLFAAAILILLWFFQIVFLDSFYKAIKLNSIKLSAESIAANIDNEELTGLVTRIAQNNDFCILITDEFGRSYLSVDILVDCVVHKLSVIQRYHYVEVAEENNGTYLEVFERGNFKNTLYEDKWYAGLVPRKDTGMMESLLYVKLAKTQNGAMVAIMLNTNLSPVDATVQTLRIQLIYVTVIMIALAFFMALILSRRISRPIEKINAASKELAIGNYKANFAYGGYREIEELGESLKEASIELAKVDSLRRELIANISHDLRTPLTMITGYAEVMRDLPGENTPDNVQVIIDEARRLTTLVNDVLDISKLQSGAVPILAVTYNFTESVKKILERFSRLTEKEGYTIDFVNDGDVWVRADELKLSQVIYNLVNNAITYTGKDKKVLVRQTLHEGRVRLSVTDTGAGIPEDKLKDIWERYYKVDKEHRRAQMGTGLGLSIVKTILELHNTGFGVESREGAGSTFWFELKLSPEKREGRPIDDFRA